MIEICPSFIPVILAIQECRDQGQSGQKVSPYLKNISPHIQRVDRVVQVVEHLSSKCEALSSNPSTTKKQKLL
jgi:hypothetical protein